MTLPLKYNLILRPDMYYILKGVVTYKFLDTKASLGSRWWRLFLST